MDLRKNRPVGKTGPQGLKTLLFISSHMKDNVAVIHFHIKSICVQGLISVQITFEKWDPIFPTGPFVRGLVFSQVHGPGAGPVFTWCFSNASSTTYISSNSFFSHCLVLFVPIYCINHLLESATLFTLVLLLRRFCYQVHI